MKITCFCTLLLLRIATGTCFGQAAVQDSALVAAAVKKADSLYTQTIASDSPLYQGLEYVDYDKSYLVGHQFYRTNSEANGTIHYNGATFTQVSFLYDIVLDQIVIEHPESSYRISLISDKIKSFSYLNHTFIRLKSDSLTGSPIQTGFYDLLISGHTPFLVRRTKNIQERAGHNGMEGEFHAKDKYFVQKNKQYYQVHSKKSVFKLLSDQRPALQKYSRSHKLKFRKKREAALINLVKYYNTLPPTTS